MTGRDDKALLQTTDNHAMVTERRWSPLVYLQVNPRRPHITTDIEQKNNEPRYG